MLTYSILKNSADNARKLLAADNTIYGKLFVTLSILPCFNNITVLDK